MERKEFISDEVVLPKIEFIKFVETIFAKKIAINSLCKKTSKCFSLIALEIFLMPVTPIIILITIVFIAYIVNKIENRQELEKCTKEYFNNL